MSTPYFRGWVLQGLSQTITTLGGDVKRTCGFRGSGWSDCWKRVRQN
jgi:hypothetical protein